MINNCDLYHEAIKAYRFQIERYNTWMNYYAMFVGALFVGLYFVWSNMPCGSERSFIIGLLIVLGWFTSMCWLASAIGNDRWIKSWLANVRRFEGRDGIYSQIKKSKIDRECPCSGEKYMCGYISTTKITRLFIMAIMTAWGVMFRFAVCGCSCICRMIVCSFVVTLVAVFVLQYIPLRLWSSDVKDMQGV